MDSDALDIPKGNSREEIKSREKIIKDFYARWIAEHPSKAIWNKSIKQFIKVKYLSINETCARAARSYASTVATLRLTDILENAELVRSEPRKTNDQNQKGFSKILILRYQDIKLVVGFQHSCEDYVQYCISVPNEKKKKPLRQRLSKRARIK